MQGGLALGDPKLPHGVTDPECTQQHGDMINLGSGTLQATGRGQGLMEEALCFHLGPGSTPRPQGPPLLVCNMGAVSLPPRSQQTTGTRQVMCRAELGGSAE